MDQRGGDLASIQAQFDTRYRAHLSSLDEAFARNLQWLDGALDDGLRQLGAEPRRSKRKQPDVPLFTDEKENQRIAKSKAGGTRRQTRTRASALKDAPPNSPKNVQESGSMPPPPPPVERQAEAENTTSPSTEPVTETETTATDFSPSPKRDVVEPDECKDGSPESTEDDAGPVQRVSKSGLFDGTLPDDLFKLTVVMLKQELKARGADLKGLKKVLVNRLETLLEEDAQRAQASCNKAKPSAPKKRKSEEAELKHDNESPAKRMSSEHVVDSAAEENKKGSPEATVDQETMEHAPKQESPTLTEPSPEMIAENPVAGAEDEHVDEKASGACFIPEVQSPNAEPELCAAAEEVKSASPKREAPVEQPEQPAESPASSPAPSSSSSEPSPLTQCAPEPEDTVQVVDEMPQPQVEPEPVIARTAASMTTELLKAPSIEDTALPKDSPATRSHRGPAAGQNDELRRKIQMLTETQSNFKPMAPKAAWVAGGEDESSAPQKNITELTKHHSSDDIVVVDTATTWQRPATAPAPAPAPTPAEVAVAVPPAGPEQEKGPVREKMPTPAAVARPASAATAAPLNKHEAAAERRRALEQEKRDERAAKELKREQREVANTKRLHAEAVARARQAAEEKERRDKERREKANRAKLDARMRAPQNKTEPVAAAPSVKPLVPGFSEVNEKPPAKRISEPTSQYSISPQRDSDEETSSDEDAEPKKKHAKWTQPAELAKLLERQRHQDPDAIFPVVKTCDLGKIFNNGRERHLTRRGESGVWEKDGVTMHEMQEWRKRMGFKPAK